MNNKKKKGYSLIGKIGSSKLQISSSSLDALAMLMGFFLHANFFFDFNLHVELCDTTGFLKGFSLEKVKGIL
jgi:hypothetical protein